MTIKKIAAFHEAGHAIVGHLSKFHSIASGIDLASDGAGEIHISLSKSKLTAHGKAPEASSAKYKDVAADIAVVLAAGLVAERIAEGKVDGVTANPHSAIPDHQMIAQALSNAGLSKKFDRYELLAEEILETHWEVLVELADYLFASRAVSEPDLKAFLDARLR